MKKTFFLGCVSALLLMTSATSAFAQDAQNTTPSTTPAPADATAQAAPAAEATPAVAAEATVTTDATATTDAATAPQTATAEASNTNDTATAEEAAPPPPPKLFWRNTMFWIDQSFTAYTLTKENQLTYNPTYGLDFRFLPRVYLMDRLFLRAMLDLNVELTQSDSTTFNRQPLFSDIFLDAISPGVFRIENFNVTAGARLVLPTSIQSQAENLYLGVGALANLSYSFPNVLSGLALIFDIGYTYFGRGSNVTTIDNGYGCASLDGRPGRVCTQNGGPSTMQMQLSFGPTINLTPFERFNITAQYSFRWRKANELGTSVIDTASGPVAVGDNSVTHERNLQVFYFGVAYDVLDWLNLSLYMFTLTTEFNPNGTYRNPVFNYDTNIGLTATFTLDQLYTELTSGSPELTPEQLRRIRNGQANNNTMVRGGAF